MAYPPASKDRSQKKVHSHEDNPTADSKDSSAADLDPLDLHGLEDDEGTFALLNEVDLGDDAALVEGFISSSEEADQVEVQDGRNKTKEERLKLNSRKRFFEKGFEDQQGPYKRQKSVGYHEQVHWPQTYSSSSADAITCARTHSKPSLSHQRKKKPRSLPKRPVNAFGIFLQRKRQSIMKEAADSDLSEEDVQRKAGRLWRALPSEEIHKYEKLAEEDKKRYQSEMEAHEQEQEDKLSYSKKELPHSSYAIRYIENVISSSEKPNRDGQAPYTTYPRPEDAGRPYPTPHSAWGYPATYPRSVPLSPMRDRALVTPTSPVSVPAAHHHRPDAHGLPHPHSWPPAAYYSPDPRSYTPDFGRPARIPQPPQHQPLPPCSVPPGMELMLPSWNGGEQRFRVSYQCFTVKREDVDGFMANLQQHSHHAHHHQHSASQWNHPRW